MPWNPTLYHKFQAERFAPFDDLLGLINKRVGLSVIDLGCGTGELTRRLADHLPGSDVLGIDSSDEMLVSALNLAGRGLAFEKRAIEDVSGKWDLVFSNAAIQWVDNHQRLIPHLFDLVAEGGQLVVQLPSNHHHPSHEIMREIATEAPFRSALSGYRRISPVLSIAQYAELLTHSGGVDLVVFEKVYPHILASSDEVVSWMSGTALIPYFERLASGLQGEFLNTYRVRLKALWPDEPVFYGFQRILFSAVRRLAGPAD